MTTTTKPKTSATIFVFGSNLAGYHGGGAALVANKQHGAEWGVGEGRTGDAYALPTKDAQIETLPLAAIREHVGRFINHVRANPDDIFMLTQVGCGLAGLSKDDIAPMFVGVPDNVQVPGPWHGIVFGRRIDNRVSFDF